MVWTGFSLRQVPRLARRSGGLRWRRPACMSRPVRMEEHLPPHSASRGGSAGVWIPQGGSFLERGGMETPQSAVSPGAGSGPTLALSSPYEVANRDTMAPLCCFHLPYVSWSPPLLLQTHLLQTVPPSVVWLFLGSSPVQLTLLSRPRLEQLRLPASPSLDISGTSCQWRWSRPPSCLS